MRRCISRAANHPVLEAPKIVLIFFQEKTVNPPEAFVSRQSNYETAHWMLNVERLLLDRVPVVQRIERRFPKGKTGYMLIFGGRGDTPGDTKSLMRSRRLTLLWRLCKPQRPWRKPWG